MLLALFACTPPVTGELTVYAPEGTGLAPFLDTIGDDRIVVVEVGDAALEAGRSLAPVAVAVTVDPGVCDECYTVDEADGVYTVTGGAPLGVRYGLTALLESFGYRFFHPARTHLPAAFDEVDRGQFGVAQAPDIDRRGLHMHTLHPIDGLYSFWQGESPDRAAAIMDWAVRSRANHLQWVALDDITTSRARLAEWQPATAALVDRAHDQGLTVGLGIQLFGTSNLQLAFDLVDSPAEPDVMRASMAERIGSITEAVDWDVLNLSFGEFSGVSPEDFIEATNLAREVIREADPDIEVPAVIHVGNYDDLRVEWEGEELQYYFLVQYADPTVIPWVHTTMYYNLVEDAGLAYDHEVFDEHRAFLEEKLAAGEPVGYFPETAYWVAFDNSVPTYLPLYVRSRWADLQAFPTLEDHVIFSTGWEWGYWQNDYAALRMSWATPEDWRDAFTEMFAPVDPVLADTAIALAEAQHTHLLEGRLAAYMAGRDDFIDLGDNVGIHSQPDRPGFDEVLAMNPAESAALVARLDAMVADFARIAAPTGNDPWSVEMADGLVVTTGRAHFIAALYAAAADPSNAEVHFATAETALDGARAFVSLRHAALHDDVDGQLTVRGDNATLYDYGYLYWADELCYWQREYAEASNLLRGTALEEPACTL